MQSIMLAVNGQKKYVVQFNENSAWYGNFTIVKYNTLVYRNIKVILGISQNSSKMIKLSSNIFYFRIYMRMVSVLEANLENV